MYMSEGAEPLRARVLQHVWFVQVRLPPRVHPQPRRPDLPRRGRVLQRPASLPGIGFIKQRNNVMGQLILQSLNFFVTKTNIEKLMFHLKVSPNKSVVLHCNVYVHDVLSYRF